MSEQNGEPEPTPIELVALPIGPPRGRKLFHIVGKGSQTLCGRKLKGQRRLATIPDDGLYCEACLDKVNPNRSRSLPVETHGKIIKQEPPPKIRMAGKVKPLAGQLTFGGDVYGDRGILQKRELPPEADNT